MGPWAQHGMAELGRQGDCAAQSGGDRTAWRRLEVSCHWPCRSPAQSSGTRVGGLQEPHGSRAGGAEWAAACLSTPWAVTARLVL